MLVTYRCVLKTGVIKSPVKLYVRFLLFFKIQKNMTFYVFELLRTFSRTLLGVLSDDAFFRGVNPNT